MKNIITDYPEVADAFFTLTRGVTKAASFEKVKKELILVSMFVVSGGLNGLVTHTKRYLDAGGDINEIYETILLALPVVGITNVTLSFNRIKELEGSMKNENN